MGRAPARCPRRCSTYLAAHGEPIRYRHLPEPRPLADYQTIFATEPGSAEMPSAGRPFSARVLEALEDRGITVATVVLHTGVSSLERGERPVPRALPRARRGTLAAVRAARRRVIAVGTTVVRALETARARRRSTEGWTRLVVEPERGVRVVDGILTGWHEPDASHLLMLEAIAGRRLVERSYAAALADGYRWHEFGDLHLLLGGNVPGTYPQGNRPPGDSPPMHAIRLHEFGPAENLRYEEVEDPEPGPGQVRIAVAAAGVHLVDTTIRAGGRWARIPLPELPAIPGREVAGRRRRGRRRRRRAPGSGAAWSPTSARRAPATPSWRCARSSPARPPRRRWPTTPRWR